MGSGAPRLPREQPGPGGEPVPVDAEERTDAPLLLVQPAGGFASDTGPPDHDIYVAPLTVFGFAPPQVVPGLNTAQNDVRPNLRADGLEIVFDSDRTGDTARPTCTRRREQGDRCLVDAGEPRRPINSPPARAAPRSPGTVRPSSSARRARASRVPPTSSSRRARRRSEGRGRRRAATLAGVPLASVYPLVRTRALARTLHVPRCPKASAAGPSWRCGSAAPLSAGSSSTSAWRRPTESRSRPSSASSGRSRRRSSTSRCGSPTTTARPRRGRSSSWRRPSAPVAGSAGHPPAASRCGVRASRPQLTADQLAAVARVVGALDTGGGHVLLHGPTGSGKTEVYLQACADGARARARGDRARARDRAHPADGRALPSSLRRPGGGAPLRAHRRRAAGRARADRPRGGAHRGRRPLGGVRAARQARADRRRRGARRLLQAGVGPALRRPYGGGEAGCAGGGGRCVRQRHPSAGELAAARAARARGEDRRADAARAGRRPAPRGRVPAVGAAAARARTDRRGRRQGDPAPQPARRGACAPLPGLRRIAPVRPL